MFSEAFSGGGCDDYTTSAPTRPLSLEIIKSAPFPTLTKLGHMLSDLGACPLVARHAKLIPLIIF
jgi:hypothetical protein